MIQRNTMASGYCFSEEVVKMWFKDNENISTCSGLKNLKQKSIFLFEHHYPMITRTIFPLSWSLGLSILLQSTQSGFDPCKKISISNWILASAGYNAMLISSDNITLTPTLAREMFLHICQAAGVILRVLTPFMLKFRKKLNILYHIWTSAKVSWTLQSPPCLR